MKRTLIAASLLAFTLQADMVCRTAGIHAAVVPTSPQLPDLIQCHAAIWPVSPQMDLLMVWGDAVHECEWIVWSYYDGGNGGPINIHGPLSSQGPSASLYEYVPKCANNALPVHVTISGRSIGAIKWIKNEAMSFPGY